MIKRNYNPAKTDEFNELRVNNGAGSRAKARWVCRESVTCFVTIWLPGVN